MLQCPKCGTDNLLSAIFCRGCGDRLELDNLKPEVFTDNKQTKAQRIAKIVNIILGIVLTVLIVLVAVGALYPVSGRMAVAEPSEEALQSYNTLLKRGRARSLTFSSEDASALVNKQLKTFSGSPGTPEPEAVTVVFLGDGDVKLILSAKLKVVSMHTTLIVTPTFASPGNMTLEVKKAKLGFLPLPEGLRPKLTDNFKTIAKSTLENARVRIAKTTISDGSAVVERVGR